MAGEAEIERMVVRLLGDASHYEKTLKTAANKTTSFVQTVGKKMQDVGRSMSAIGRSMSLKVTAPIAGMAAASVYAFSTFDKAITESTSIFAGMTDKMRAKMRTFAREMAVDGVTSATDIGRSYYYLGSAGLDAQRSMDNMKTVLDFSIAGAFDAATATDILTDSYTALKWASDDAAVYQKNMVRLSDALVLATTQANATTQQFGEATMGDAGGAAAQYGMELETLMAVLGGYASASKKGAEASNMFGRATRMLTAAYLKHEPAFKKLGIEMINEATGEWENFINVVEMFEKVFAGMTGPQITMTMEDLGIETLQQKALLPLLGQSATMRKWETEQKTLAKGKTADVVAQQMKSFSNQMKNLKNQITDVAIGIGERLAPWLLKLNGIVTKARLYWNSLSEPIKKTVFIIAAIAAAVGPALIVLGNLVGAVGLVLVVVAAAIPVVAAAIPVVTAFVSTWAGTAVIVAGITALGAAVVYYSGIGGKALEWFGEKWQALVNYLNPALKGIGDALKDGNIKSAMEIMWAQLDVAWLQGIHPLREAWQGFLMWMQMSFANTKQWLSTKWIDWSEFTGAITKESADAQRALAGNIGFVARREIEKSVVGTMNAFDTEIAVKQQFLKQLLGKQLLGKQSGMSPLAGVPEMAGGSMSGLDFTKGLQQGARVSAPPVNIEAAQIGTAEAQSRILAFKSGTGPADNSRKTADNTEKIAEILGWMKERAEEQRAFDHINTFSNSGLIA